jgi:hypothetical protein
MATLNTDGQGAGFTHGLNAIPSGSFSTNTFSDLNASNYVSLYDLANMEDNRELLVKTFGAQGITGFLQMVGAVKANGTADEVQYWEETRLHVKQKVNGQVTGAATMDCTCDAGAQHVRLNDVVLTPDGERALVVKIISATQFTIISLTSSNLNTLSAADELVIIGNLYAQGTDQPTSWRQSGLVKRTNKYNIIKDVYKVSGSQATNIGWVNVGGKKLWYIKSEADTRQRFMDSREMMMILGKDISNATSADSGDLDHTLIDGGEGYFAAIEDRGIVASDILASLSDVDDMVKVLDKEGGASEYAMYVNRAQDLKLDDVVAQAGTQAATNGAAKFGSFQNSPETAIALGFRSFNRGGYTFHKHDWRLLNDPTLLADNKFAGVCVPMSKVADPKTGEKSPSLEMNYKAVNGYSREMEHWMTGSVLGVSNATEDSVSFHYRSECNLITRAANQHVLIKSA